MALSRARTQAGGAARGHAGTGTGAGAGPRSDRLLPSAPASPAAARAAVDELSDTLPPDRLADLRLLVSELVANSVEHGPRDEPIRLRISSSAQRVRAEVRDGGNGFIPPSAPPSSLSDGGRGLLLVDRMADSWGVGSGASTSVWVELSRRPVP